MSKIWMGDSMTFGEQIRLAREKLQLSQEDASTAIEKKYGVRLSASYLSMIESGVRTNITVNLLNALLDFFNLPVEAAASLFCKPITDKHPQEAQVMETWERYHARPPLRRPEDLARLPDHAKWCLAEFQEYLITKYIQKN